MSSRNYIPISFVLAEGRPLLSMDMRDERGAPVLAINENELVFSATSWDVTFIGTTLTIRDGPGKFGVVLRFEAPDTVHVERGTIISTPRGTITIDGHGVMRFPGGGQISGYLVEDCGGGFGF